MVHTCTITRWKGGQHSYFEGKGRGIREGAALRSILLRDRLLPFLKRLLPRRNAMGNGRFISLSPIRGKNGIAKESKNRWKTINGYIYKSPLVPVLTNTKSTHFGRRRGVCLGDILRKGVT